MYCNNYVRTTLLYDNAYKIYPAVCIQKEFHSNLYPNIGYSNDI